MEGTDAAAPQWTIVAALPASVQLVSTQWALFPTDMTEVVRIIPVVMLRYMPHDGVEWRRRAPLRCRFPPSPPHTGQAPFSASGVPTDVFCLSLPFSLMYLQVTLFAERLCLLVPVGPNFCKQCPFGFHPVCVVNLFGWSFFAAFADSFTFGKC
jgi:hypothetical protein